MCEGKTFALLDELKHVMTVTIDVTFVLLDFTINILVLFMGLFRASLHHATE